MLSHCSYALLAPFLDRSIETMLADNGGALRGVPSAGEMEVERRKQVIDTSVVSLPQELSGLDRAKRLNDGRC